MKESKEVQRKITDDYSPELARQKVTTFFESHPEIAKSTNELSDTKVCVLAALFDGKSITTSGYSIPSDYGVKRASAVAHALEKIHNFPISHSLVDTESDVGKMTKQARFNMTETDREKLQKDPEIVFKEKHEQTCKTRETQAQKEMKRLVKEYGENGVLELLKRAANDESGSKNAG